MYRGGMTTRAIVLTTQRTGSTFLEDCLEAHPQIFCVGELLINGINVRAPDVLMQWRYMAKLYRFMVGGAWNPTALMERFYSSDERRVNIFKAMYNHLVYPPTLRYLTSQTDIRVIHLRRHNVLKQYVSKLLLSKRRVKRWQPHTTKPVPVVQIPVDPQRALEHIRRTRADYERFEHAFSAHARLPLVYEDLIENGALKPMWAEQICGFLGADLAPMKSRLVKMNPDRLADMVTNYDELAAVIGRSEYADMLD